MKIGGVPVEIEHVGLKTPVEQRPLLFRPMTIRGVTIRNRIAAVDPGSGAVSGWNPVANGSVLALALEKAGRLDDRVAIRDAIRVTGTKEYVRFYKRARPQDRFEPVVIDLAAA